MKLKVVGAGGIGSTVLLYLASSGLGHITVSFDSNVHGSNLFKFVLGRNVV